MEYTRAALTDKLETLEQQVVQTVTGTTAAVAETVENVKEAVHETVDAVKGSVQEGVNSVRNAIDLSRQMERHPWLLLAGSIAVGYLGERLLEQAATGSTTHAGGSSWPLHRRHDGAPHGPRTTDGATERFATDRAHAAFASPEPEKRSLFETIASEFSGELNKVKSLAIGAGLGVVRDLLSQAVPDPLKPRVSQVVDSVTTKLGGDVVQGPLCAPSTGSAATSQGGFL